MKKHGMYVMDVDIQKLYCLDFLKEAQKVAQKEDVYVYTKAFEAYSRGLRKAGQPIVNTRLFKWTPERIKRFLSKGFIRRKR